MDQVSSYTSADPLFYSNLSVANPPPTSVLYAFSLHDTVPAGTLALPASTEDLERFVNRHRHPTLVKLTSSNYKDVMESDLRSIVVLGALRRGEEGESDRKRFLEVAKAWRKGGRPFQQPVWFAWVEAEKWRAWLKQSYGWVNGMEVLMGESKRMMNQQWLLWIHR